MHFSSYWQTWIFLLAWRQSWMSARCIALDLFSIIIPRNPGVDTEINILVEFFEKL